MVTMVDDPVAGLTVVVGGTPFGGVLHSWNQYRNPFLILFLSILHSTCTIPFFSLHKRMKFNKN